MKSHNKTTLAQYLVSLEVTYSQKSKTRDGKAINSLQINKEGRFHARSASGKLMHCCPKSAFTAVFQPQPCS